MEYVALDLETTGLDPERDRVIEVGAVAFHMGGVVARLDRLVDPRRSVPDAVLKLTGIQPGELQEGAAQEAALKELADFVGGRHDIGPRDGLDTGVIAA